MMRIFRKREDQDEKLIRNIERYEQKEKAKQQQSEVLGQKPVKGKTNKEKNTDDNLSSKVKNQLKNTNQVKTNLVENLSIDASSKKNEILNFQELINLANQNKEIELKFDLERNVKLVSFKRGKIDISFNEKLNKNFIKNLTEKLLLWTGERWIISLSKNDNAKSIHEMNLEEKNSKIEEYKKTKIAQDIQRVFPDAKLIDFKEED